MTLRYIDGFDYLPVSYPSNNGLLYWQEMGWYMGFNSPGIGGVSTAFGYGKCISAGFTSFQRYLNTTNPTITFGVRVFMSSNGGQNFVFVDSAHNQTQVQVELNANGTITIVNGATNVVLGVSTPGSYPNGAWFYLEVQMTTSTTAGTVIVKVNGNVVISLTSQNTQYTTNPYSDMWGANAGSGTTCYIDDLYILDAAGAQNTSFLGDVRVWMQLPSGAGATTELSRVGSQPTNWQTAQNLNLDDTQYVYTPTAGQYDLYTLPALVTGPSIYGVQTRNVMRQDDATTVNAETVLQSGATQVTGASHTVNQSYYAFCDIWELDPNTSSGWTISAVNSLQIGPKKLT